MSKRKPYTPPRVIRYESEAEYPDWTGDIVLSLRQELEAPQFEVKPHYVTVVDSDRKYVEVSDSFCQLVGTDRQAMRRSDCPGYVRHPDCPWFISKAWIHAWSVAVH